MATNARVFGEGGELDALAAAMLSTASQTVAIAPANASYDWWHTVDNLSVSTRNNRKRLTVQIRLELLGQLP